MKRSNACRPTAASESGVDETDETTEDSDEDEQEHQHHQHHQRQEGQQEGPRGRERVWLRTMDVLTRLATSASLSVCLLRICFSTNSADLHTPAPPSDPPRP